MVRKKFICNNCGAVNLIEITPEDLSDTNNDDWLQCVLPAGFEWALPAGKITPVVGDPIYITGNGEQMSRDDYILKYNIDPEIAYQLMRGRILKSPAYASMGSQINQRAKASVRRVMNFNLADDDDWTA